MLSLEEFTEVIMDCARYVQIPVKGPKSIYLGELTEGDIEILYRRIYNADDKKKDSVRGDQHG